ncbi:MAG TPA: GntR family transcriptional regulator [Polyangiaceae bacterium]|jgi:DNA-binding FadR family transcriptional regulator|nr:GntR family transcriptional regulator [Polyangiaceae bacterium]
MPLRVIRNLSLADQVFEQLATEILTGHFAPGAQIPPERTLVTTFKVNRHVVREALKRLEQIGLVKVAQGGGTIALDFKKTAGLDLLALMAEYAQADDQAMTYWLSVHEMRAAVASDAARLCALRASKEAKAEILATARKMAEVADGPELFMLEFRFWELVLDGANNIAYRLAYNSLVRAVLSPAAAELAQTWSIHEIKEAEYRLPIARAIVSGDAATAESETRHSLGLVLTHLATRLGVDDSESSRGRPATKAPQRRAKRRR